LYIGRERDQQRRVSDVLHGDEGDRGEHNAEANDAAAAFVRSLFST
jgi:hypothetical protein